MKPQADDLAVFPTPDAPAQAARPLIEAQVVLFDIEGTLVDAVPLTLKCWTETLAEFGRKVTVETLQPLSGMDGGDLLSRLFPDLTDDVKSRILKSQGERYRSQYLQQVQPFPRVAELFRWLRSAGKSIGLATDSSRDEVDRYVALTGIRGMVDACGSGDEVRHGKPHPDVIDLALKELGAAPRDAVMIGDTPYDMSAACQVGTRAVGLLTGGFGQADLVRAGAEAVAPDVGALFEAVLNR
ncbi:HAD family hydrolase [Rhodoplanes sp. Z2-YC6860]|uniref:HAD family hydrolase n=1 Tax=Rhodoplanes sp. Z2-YC6860 TaxID=674703 RepID=UPI00078BE1CD|nr:HAD-IA family hydrolase [Rhodoplanes sp. Z2-YC6860]AMN41820.1 HAD family hydrolase [Rhodoplanes sp. Z2-YC6860]